MSPEARERHRAADVLAHRRQRDRERDAERRRRGLAPLEEWRAAQSDLAARLNAAAEADD